MSPRLGRIILTLSGMGFPLTQLAIRRLDRRGAMLTEAVCGGLLIRDVAMIAGGAPGRLRRGPAILLWLEAAAGAASVVVGLRPLKDASGLAGATAERPDRLEAVRRAAVGTLFGLHTWRFRIFLQPDHGLRPAS
jgi:hypothetical protein